MTIMYVPALQTFFRKGLIETITVYYDYNKTVTMITITELR